MKFKEKILFLFDKEKKSITINFNWFNHGFEGFQFDLKFQMIVIKNISNNEN